MNREDSNHVNMITTTTDFCTDNTAATAGITGFAPVLLTVKNKLVLVNNLDIIAMGTSTGVTANSKTLRTTMTSITLKCANAVFAFAESTNDDVLKAIVRFKKAALDALKKDEIDDVCQSIRNAADTNIAGATPFGIDATDVTDLQTAIDLFRVSIQKPRQSIITIDDAKKQIKEIIFEIINKNFRNQMDRMVNTLLLSNPNFHHQYTLAREVINIGIHHTRLNEFVKDAGGAGIQGVTVSLIKNNLVTKFAITGADGKISITKITPDTYDIKTEKAAFVTKLETGVQFKAGKKVLRSVTLVSGDNTPTLTSVIREGNTGPGDIIDIDISDFEITASTTVQIIISGNEILLSAAPAPGPTLGPTVWHVFPGTQNKTIDAFAALVGFDGTNIFLKIQSSGLVSAHYKITFNNVLV